MSTHELVGTVAAGRYLIEVGRDAGLALDRRPADADDARLADALARHADPPPAPADPAPAEPGAADGDDDGALAAFAEVTARCEEAADFFGAIVRGDLLDPDHVGARLDVMLELVQRLDRDRHHEQALRLARAVAKVMALLARWRHLAKTLHSALHAAGELGKRGEAARAWAEHELGTLELVAGRMRQADKHLSAARDLRLRDRRALALTERNLQLLCGRLRELAREGALERRRPRRLRTAALAAVLLLLGVLTGSVIADDDPPDPAVAATPTPTLTATPTPSATPTPTASPTATAVAEVTHDVHRKGEGRVTGPELDCGDDCRARRPAGSTATLRAEPDPGWRFVRWGGVACETPVCEVEFDDDLTVTAVFARDSGPTPTPTPPIPDPIPGPDPVPPPDIPPDPIIPPEQIPAPDPIPIPVVPPDSQTVPAQQGPP